MTSVTGSALAHSARSTVFGARSASKSALKRIRRHVVFGNDAKEGLQQFITDMRIIKSLRHRHIVEFVGSYTDPNYLALIMSPVAEMNLTQFLERTPTTGLSKPEAEALRSFIGCLATALEYLHSSCIRHRDIKPQNILINNAKILFTDFGLSKDYSGEADSITSGFTGRTPKYCAPEVAEGSSRNSSSDVWSLGCVFLEMIAVLKGKTMPAIKDFCLTNWTSESSFHRNPETTDLLIEELSSTPVDKKPLGITERMLARERSSRPTAAEIASFLITSRTEEEYETQYCGLCCLHEYDSDSQDDLCDEESPTTPYFDSQQRLVGPLTLSVSSSSDQEGDPTLRATDMGIIRHDSLNTEAATSSGETTAVDQHPGATSAVRNATEELNVRTISPQEYQTSTIGYLPTSELQIQSIRQSDTHGHDSLLHAASARRLWCSGRGKHQLRI